MSTNTAALPRTSREIQGRNGDFQLGRKSVAHTAVHGAKVDFGRHC